MNILSPRTAQYRARKLLLICKLGNKCARCGNTVYLQFDCIKPRGYQHHLLGSLDRITFYESEAAAENLQLLCVAHHVAKSTEDLRARRKAATVSKLDGCPITPTGTERFNCGHPGDNSGQSTFDFHHIT